MKTLKPILLGSLGGIGFLGIIYLVSAIAFALNIPVGSLK